MHNAYLYIDDLKIPIKNLDYNFTQFKGANSKPSSGVIGGEFSFTYDIDNKKTIPLIRWMLSPTLQKNGFIEILDFTQSSIAFKLEFANAYATNQTFQYDAFSNLPLQANVTVTTGAIRFNKEVTHLQTWTPKDPFTVQEVTEVEDQEDQPKTNYSIDSVTWLHEKYDGILKSVEPLDKVRVAVKVTNIEIGEGLNLELYNSNGELLLSDCIDVTKETGGNYAIWNFTIQQKWKKQDSIYIKARCKDVKEDFYYKSLDIVTLKTKGFILEKGSDKLAYYDGKFYTISNDNKSMIIFNEKPRKLFREIKEALDIISSKPIGKKFIADIVEMSNPQFISITRKSATNSTTSRKVSWVPGDKHGGIDEKGETKRDPFVSLAHELWHAWENWTDPKMINTVWVPKKENRKAIMIKELTASEFENKIRVEHNKPRRKWYAAELDEQKGNVGYGKIF